MPASPENAIALLLAIPRKLVLQGRKLGEGRVGIGGTIALARVRRARIVPQRRPALAVALVTSLVAVAAIAVAPVALVAAITLAVAELLALVVAIAVLALAFEALAAIALLGSRFARRRAFGGSGGGGRLRRGALARLLKLLVAAPAMMFALLAFPAWP